MEIINILFQITIFITFFSISFLFLIKKFNNNFNYTDSLIFNIIIQINFILILSLFNLSLEKILIIYFMYLVTCFLFLIKKISINGLIKNAYFYFFLIGVCLVLCVDISYSLVLDWDSQEFWFYKTLNFYNQGTIKDLSFSHNPQYPFLGSLLWAVFWKISFFTEEYSGRLLYVFLYCLSLFALAEKLKLKKIYKTIFFIILVMLSYNYVHFAGSQDILVFCLISYAAKNIYEIINEENEKKLFFQIILIILICNALIWTKQEGSVYAFIIALTLVFFSKIDFINKFFLITSILFLFFLRISVYKIYNLDVSINNCCWNDLSFSAIIGKMSLERTLIIIKYFFYSFLKNSFVLLGLISFLLSFCINKLHKKIIHIYFFCLMSLTFIFSAYILSDMNIVFMLKTGLDRLIFSSSPFYILIFINYLNSKKFKFL
jgi:hypothetical protein